MPQGAADAEPPLRPARGHQRLHRARPPAAGLPARRGAAASLAPQPLRPGRAGAGDPDRRPGHTRQRHRRLPPPPGPGRAGRRGAVPLQRARRAVGLGARVPAVFPRGPGRGAGLRGQPAARRPRPGRQGAGRAAAGTGRPPGACGRALRLLPQRLGHPRRRRLRGPGAAHDRHRERATAPGQLPGRPLRRAAGCGPNPRHPHGPPHPAGRLRTWAAGPGTAGRPGLAGRRHLHQHAARGAGRQRRRAQLRRALRALPRGGAKTRARPGPAVRGRGALRRPQRLPGPERAPPGRPLQRLLRGRPVAGRRRRPARPAGRQRAARDAHALPGRRRHAQRRHRHGRADRRAEEPAGTGLRQPRGPALPGRAAQPAGAAHAGGLRRRRGLAGRAAAGAGRRPARSGAAAACRLGRGRRGLHAGAGWRSPGAAARGRRPGARRRQAAGAAHAGLDRA